MLREESVVRETYTHKCAIKRFIRDVTQRRQIKCHLSTSTMKNFVTSPNTWKFIFKKSYV